MEALAVMVLAFAGYIIMYRLYGKYIGSKIFALSGDHKTPSHPAAAGISASPFRLNLDVEVGRVYHDRTTLESPAPRAIGVLPG